MNSDTASSATPTPDVPDEPARRGWSRGHTLAAVGVAALIAAFGGAAIYAATGWGSGVHGGPGVSRWGGPRSAEDRGSGPDGWRGPAAPLHGEYVVADENGGYLIELI